MHGATKRLVVKLREVEQDKIFFHAVALAGRDRDTWEAAKQVWKVFELSGTK